MTTYKGLEQALIWTLDLRKVKEFKVFDEPSYIPVKSYVP